MALVGVDTPLERQIMEAIYDFGSGRLSGFCEEALLFPRTNVFKHLLAMGMSQSRRRQSVVAHSVDALVF